MRASSIGLLGLELLVGVVGGLDGQADAALAPVDLDDAGGDFLADLEHVLDLVHALLADLRDVDEAVDLVLQADEGAEAGELGDLAGDEVADLVELVDVLPRIGRRAASCRARCAGWPCPLRARRLRLRRPS